MSLSDKLSKVKEKMLLEKFIEGSGMGNEISYYVFDYDPKDELVVRDHIQYIIKDFNRGAYKDKIIEFDLYKMFIEFLKEEGDFEKVIKYEEDEGKEYILQATTTFVTPEVYAEKINEKVKDYGIIFITGIGKVYPYMRSHNILNSLQQVLSKDKKLVMFYPGEFSGQDLTLFNKFKDENYYRAFPLV